MKTLVLLVSAALFLGYCFRTQENKQNISYEEIGAPNLYCPTAPLFSETISIEGKKDSKDLKNIDQGWYQKVIQDIQKEEYNITYSEELRTYQSSNRANNIRFIYHNAVSHFHNTTFYSLQFITGPRQLDQKKKINHGMNSRFTLSYTYCLNKNRIESGRFAKNNCFTCFPSYAT